jgi:hypothetical protein
LPAWFTSPSSVWKAKNKPTLRTRISPENVIVVAYLVINTPRSPHFMKNECH